MWKGRLVAGGHMTDPNIYAPTVPLDVAKMQLGLASFAKAEIEVFDIPTAYLNAKLEDDILLNCLCWLIQPPKTSYRKMVPF